MLKVPEQKNVELRATIKNIAIEKIELFARKQVEGWDYWGNEVWKWNLEKIWLRL